MNDTGSPGQALARVVSAGRAGDDRSGRVSLAQAPARAQHGKACRPPRLHEHGSHAAVRRPRPHERRPRRVAAAGGWTLPRRSTRDHAAEHPPVPGLPRRCVSRRAHGRKHEPALHTARAQGSARGLRGAGDRDPRELRARSRGSDRRHRDRNGDRDRRGRSAGLSEIGADQPRRASRAPAGSGVEPARRGALQRRRCRRGATRTACRSSSVPRTSPFCSTPAAPRVSPRERCSPIAISSRTSCSSRAGSRRRCGGAEDSTIVGRCRCITCSR